MRPKWFAIDPSSKDGKENKERFKTIEQRIFDSRLKWQQEFEKNPGTHCEPWYQNPQRFEQMHHE